MRKKLKQLSYDYKDVINDVKTSLKQAKKITLSLMLIFFIIFLVFCIINIARFEYIIFSFIAFLIVSMILYAVYNYIKENQYITYKKKIILAVLSLIDSSLRYSMYNGHLQKEFFYSDLYSRNITNFISKDMIRGVAGNTAIKISHIFAERVEEIRNYNFNDDDCSINSQQVEYRHYTVFSGVFISLDFNKDFKGITKLHTKGRIFNNSETDMGTLFSKYEKITLENQMFNKYFDVITTDIQTALYILTPAFMELLLNMYFKSNTELGICFRNGIMFIAFENAYFLELGNIKDYEKNIELLYMEIKSLLNVVDELQLNNRIWTKA